MTVAKSKLRSPFLLSQVIYIIIRIIELRNGILVYSLKNKSEEKIQYRLQNYPLEIQIYKRDTQDKQTPFSAS